MKLIEWFLLLALLMFLTVLFVKPPVEKPTNPQLFMDTKTGCHYFGNYKGHIIKRLDSDGNHLGCEPIVITMPTNNIQVR